VLSSDTHPYLRHPYQDVNPPTRHTSRLMTLRLNLRIFWYVTVTTRHTSVWHWWRYKHRWCPISSNTLPALYCLLHNNCCFRHSLQLLLIYPRITVLFHLCCGSLTQMLSICLMSSRHCLANPFLLQNLQIRRITL